MIDTQEQLNEKTIAVSIRTSKLTAKVLAKALVTLVRKFREEKTPAGKQSIKKLVRQGAQLQNIEINDGNIKSFERTARKFGIDFALKKDVANSPPKYVVFFKAKDIDVMTLAFQEFSRQVLKRTKEKPSILKRLAQFREMFKDITAPVKHRTKGGHEL
jgi:hypothetical protein